MKLHNSRFIYAIIYCVACSSEFEASSRDMMDEHDAGDGASLAHHRERDASAGRRISFPFGNQNLYVLPGEDKIYCVDVAGPNDPIHATGYEILGGNVIHHAGVLLLRGAEPNYRIHTCANPEAPDSQHLAVVSKTPWKESFSTAGDALTIDGGENLHLRLHVVNTTEELVPLIGEVVFTVTDSPSGTIGPIALSGGMKLRVPPKTQQVVKIDGIACPVPASIRIHSLTGHHHWHSKRLSAFINDELVYESRSPDNPPTSLLGGISIGPGDSLSWECEIDNTSDAELTYKNDAETGEMCNLYGFFSPSIGKTWRCKAP